ncbi:hypothetical protein [Parashewanella tropica]|uniref:hypothetical protein n=1 Tax=Parashewanella tropica TaxID=2547970 RepID=UPI0010595980|nr:hypothetical protein [Parashewanella tropica]
MAAEVHSTLGATPLCSTTKNQTICDQFLQFKQRLISSFPAVSSITSALYSAGVISEETKAWVSTAKGVSSIDMMERVFNNIQGRIMMSQEPIDIIIKVITVIEGDSGAGKYIAASMREVFQLPVQARVLATPAPLTCFHSTEPVASPRVTDVTSRLHSFSLSTLTPAGVVTPESKLQSIKALKQALGVATKEQMKQAFQNSFDAFLKMIAKDPFVIAKQAFERRLISSANLSHIETVTQQTNSGRAIVLLNSVEPLITLSSIDEQSTRNYLLIFIAICSENPEITDDPAAAFLNQLVLEQTASCDSADGAQPIDTANQSTSQQLLSTPSSAGVITPKSKPQLIGELEQSLESATIVQIKLAWNNSFFEIKKELAKNVIATADQAYAEGWITQATLAKIKNTRSLSDVSRSEYLLGEVEQRIQPASPNKEASCRNIIAFMKFCPESTMTKNEPVAIFLRRLQDEKSRKASIPWRR